ncbi:MAG: hypothetical protein Fur0039_06940 [Rhodocyclaceae bacterium]
MKNNARSVAIGVALAVCAAARAHAAPADEVRAMVEQGQAARAYELARQHPDSLGDPAFDFWFGVAAIASGRAGEGVLALERFVVNAPDNLNGRLELARGYFVLGEDGRAREEFQRVLSANPPPEVQANVQRFLDAIRAREFLYRPTAGFYLEAGAGADSNANAGVSGSSVTLPIGLTLTVDPIGVRESQLFHTLGAGFNWSRPLRPGMYLTAGGAFDGKYHDPEGRLDQQGWRADAGLTWIRQKNLWRVGAGFSALWVDSDRYRDLWSLTAEWHRQIDELRSFSLFGQYGDFDYAGANSPRDSGLTTIGVGYRQALISPMQPLLSASLYAGREDVRGALRADLSRDLAGGRVSASITPAPRWSLAAGLSYQESRFDGGAPIIPPPTPAAARYDAYTALDFSLSYALTRSMTLKGDLLFARNVSSEPLSAYRREVLGVKLRYDFK